MCVSAVYVQICTRDVHSWYCDNLLGGEEKTVKTKARMRTENCYLTQHPHRWNKLLVYYNSFGLAHINSRFEERFVIESIFTLWGAL